MIQYLHIYDYDMISIRVFWISVQTLGSQEVQEWKHLDYSIMMSDDKSIFFMISKGKGQWLCFAGAAVKRYPTSKVRKTQVRQ